MKTKIYLFLLIAATITGCKEKIDISLDTSASKIVIEGSVTNEMKKHMVVISRSTGYFNNGKPYVSGATVIVNDGQNQYKYKETDPGIYYSENDFAGIPGKTYTLTVHADSQYYFATSTLIPVTDIDSIQLEKATICITPGKKLDPKKKWFNILLFCQEPGNTRNYYLMDGYKNGKMITDTITNKGISDDLLYNGQYIRGTKTLQIDAEPGDTITFQLSSIDRYYYDYVRSIYDLDMNGSPFAGTPSNVKGNISGGALGFFYAAAVSKHSKVIR